MRTLIEHGTLVTAADTFAADLLIDGERIEASTRTGWPPTSAAAARSPRPSAGCAPTPSSSWSSTTPG